MIAEITPLRRLPAGLSYFDYQIPEKLQKQIKLGQLVQMPFKASQIFGIVTKLKKTSAEKNLKSLTGVLPAGLTAEQLHLLNWLADYYRISPATLLRLFIPEPPRKNATVKELKPTIKPVNLKKITNVSADAWFIYDDLPNLQSYIAAVLKQAKTGQIAIIVPEHYQCAQIGQILGLKGLSDALFIPSKVNKNGYWQAWLKSGKQRIIVGHFQALFLPYSNLKQIIVVESDNLQFQQAEQSPRLHLADIILKLKEIYQANLLLTTVSPNLELYYKTKDLQLPLKSLQTKIKNLTVVDKEQERKKKNYAMLSEEVVDKISNGNSPVLLYLNKHDLAKNSSCRDCGWIAVCPSCGQSLALNDDSKLLTCWNCRHTEDNITSCYGCGGTNLKTSGRGLQKLLAEIKERFPDKNILAFSNQHLQKPQDIRSADIVVATSKILTGDFHFKLAVMVDADQDLFLADFQASQNLRRQIFKLNLISDQLIVQTSYPNHYAFHTLNSFPEFYQAEMDFRKSFDYPPQTISYKIFIKGDGQNDSQNILADLKKLIPAGHLAGQVETTKAKQTSYKLILRGRLENQLIDSLNQKFNNKLVIETNPYNWL